jgi:hypothetical protein
MGSDAVALVSARPPPWPTWSYILISVRLGGAGRSDSAAGAADVLHDDLLSRIIRHRLRHEACEAVGRSTGGERHDHRDGAGRIALGLRGRCPE